MGSLRVGNTTTSAPASKGICPNAPWMVMRCPPDRSPRAPSEHESGPSGSPRRRRRTKIGPGHVTYAMAAHHEGHSMREIAAALEVGVATVDRMLRHPRNVDPVLLGRLVSSSSCSAY